MIGMLYDLQTVPAVADVWAKAQCAIRRPSAWTIATSVVKGLTFSLDIEPRLKEVTLASTATAGHAEPLYRLPVDLNSGKRNLTRVEIMVGPAHGAEMLLAGIRSIRAAHPTKPKQEFLAQVLAAEPDRAGLVGLGQCRPAAIESGQDGAHLGVAVRPVTASACCDRRHIIRYR